GGIPRTRRPRARSPRAPGRACGNCRGRWRPRDRRAARRSPSAASRGSRAWRRWKASWVLRFAGVGGLRVQGLDGAHQVLALGLGRARQRLAWMVEEFVREALGERLQHLGRVVAAREALPRARELGLAVLVGAPAQLD